MIKRISIAVLFAGLLGTTAMAACPTSVPGTASEAIRANAERVQCLQSEVDQDTRQRQFELELRANDTAIQHWQLQRRFDDLPRPIIPATPFGQPDRFAPY